ncbi:MAG: hypothetical protein L3J10_10540 [Sulfurimonas sp.]|nr:hypothetical protein [Sulfurimonas sp.]
MHIHERRRSHGTYKPNLFFLLQIIIICFIAYIIIQFNFGTGIAYTTVAISIMFIIYFYMRRNEVINREVIERDIVDGKIIHHND